MISALLVPANNTRVLGHFVASRGSGLGGVLILLDIIRGLVVRFGRV